MTKEEFLTDEINNKYKSVMAFSKNIKIPYTTIKGMLTRGVDGASVQTVIKVCTALGISAEYLINEEFNKKNLQPLDVGGENDMNYESKTLDILTDAFIRLGYINPGGDISNRDLEFCKAVITIIRAFYGN